MGGDGQSSRGDGYSSGAGCGLIPRQGRFNRRGIGSGVERFSCNGIPIRISVRHGDSCTIDRSGGRDRMNSTVISSRNIGCTDRKISIIGNYQPSICHSPGHSIVFSRITRQDKTACTQAHIIGTNVGAFSYRRFPLGQRYSGARGISSDCKVLDRFLGAIIGLGLCISRYRDGYTGFVDRQGAVYIVEIIIASISISDSRIACHIVRCTRISLAAGNGGGNEFTRNDCFTGVRIFSARRSDFNIAFHHCIVTVCQLRTIVGLAGAGRDDGNVFGGNF